MTLAIIDGKKNPRINVGFGIGFPKDIKRKNITHV